MAHDKTSIFIRGSICIAKHCLLMNLMPDFEFETLESESVSIFTLQLHIAGTATAGSGSDHRKEIATSRLPVVSMGFLLWIVICVHRTFIRRLL